MRHIERRRRLQFSERYGTKPAAPAPLPCETPMMPPFRGFPQFEGMRWTKRFQGMRCARLTEKRADGMGLEFPRLNAAVAKRYHEAWLDSRTLEDGTERNAPVPPRGMKTARRVRAIIESTCDSETFAPDNLPDVSDVEPFDPRP